MKDDSVICKNENQTPQSGEVHPTISVLLPVYNAEDYLHAAIESVLVQTYCDFELLILDDGSTDKSLAISKEFETKDKRVRIISRENKGLVETLNELISEASGIYLARMDADDICLPQRFEKQVAFMDAHPNHVVVGSLIEAINAKGQPILITSSPTDHKEIDEAHLAGHTAICHPTALMLREAVEKANGYDINYIHAEDLDLWLRLAEIGLIANLPEVTLQYRLHSESVSQTAQLTQIENMQKSALAALQRRGIESNVNIKVNQWRPSNNITSRHKFAVKYGWQSWGNGYRNTWWTYAFEALRLKPLSLSSWRLFIFGLIKRPKQ